MATGVSLLVHPAIAESYASVLGAGACDHDLSGVAVEGSDLLRRFGVVSDGRSEQGRDHPAAVVLTLCAAAVPPGMRSFTAIAGWVADVPTELLARLYTRPAGPPSKTTLWRVLTGADPAAVDAAVGAWLVEQAATRAAEHADGTAGTRGDPDEPALVAIAVDGKTVRGALDACGNQVHLLAAATHQDCLVLGQVEVGANRLPRGRLHRPHPLRPPSHGRPEKPRHRRIPPARTPRHHRSHPLGHPCHGPAIQDPQPHIMILERPCDSG